MWRSIREYVLSHLATTVDFNVKNNKKFGNRQIFSITNARDQFSWNSPMYFEEEKSNYWEQTILVQNVEKRWGETGLCKQWGDNF